MEVKFIHLIFAGIDLLQFFRIYRDFNIDLCHGRGKKVCFVCNYGFGLYPESGILFFNDFSAFT